MTDHSLRLVRPGIIEVLGVSGPARGGWRAAAHIKSSAIDCFETNGCELSLYIGNKPHPITVMIPERDAFNAACRTVVAEMAAAKYHGQLDVVHSELKLVKETLQSLKDSQSELQNSVQVMDMTAIYAVLGEMSRRMDEFDEDLRKELANNHIYTEPLDSTDSQEIPDMILTSAPAPAVAEAAPADAEADEEEAEDEDHYEDDKEVAADAITVFCTMVGVTCLFVGGWFTLTSITHAYVESGALDAYL